MEWWWDVLWLLEYVVVIVIGLVLDSGLMVLVLS